AFSICFSSLSYFLQVQAGTHHVHLCPLACFPVIFFSMSPYYHICPVVFNSFAQNYYFYTSLCSNFYIFSLISDRSVLSDTDSLSISRVDTLYSASAGSSRIRLRTACAARRAFSSTFWRTVVSAGLESFA